MKKLRGKLVVFKDGSYAFRRFSLFHFTYVYLDLVTFDIRPLWWPIASNWFAGSCKKDNAWDVIVSVGKIEHVHSWAHRDYGRVVPEPEHAS